MIMSITSGGNIQIKLNVALLGRILLLVILYEQFFSFIYVIYAVLEIVWFKISLFLKTSILS
jgi:hypothetical protein